MFIPKVKELNVLLDQVGVLPELKQNATGFRSITGTCRIKISHIKCWESEFIFCIFIKTDKGKN